MIVKDKVYKAFKPAELRKKRYWKEVALKKASTENEAKELTDLKPSTVF